MSGNLHEDQFWLTHIGITAQRFLKETHAGVVFGVTSRGIFLRTDLDGIAFLSYESFRGPLTANLAGEFQAFTTLHNGARFRQVADALFFDSIRSRLSLFAPAWEAPMPAAGSMLDEKERRTRLRELAQRVLAEKNDGLSALLAAQSGLSNADDDRLGQVGSDELGLLHALKGSLSQSSLDGLRQTLAHQLGRGRGLTPSGDDFALGFLLALNRWGRGLGWSQPVIHQLNADITHEAQKRTTLLSQRLLQAAVGGKADERLVLACDALFTAGIDIDQAARGLLTWGASSGVDALAGMAYMVS